MIKIGFSEIEKYYGANKVLDQLTFDVHESEVVGILGANGAGKTTLFKLLLGSEKWESGQIFISKQAKIGLLEQIPKVNPEISVRMYLQSAFNELIDIQREMKFLEQRLMTEQDETLIQKYGKLQTAFELGNGYEVEDKIDQICKTLSISNEMQAQFYMKLSGGEKTRVNLAKILLQDVNVLLLDEPTNHLDLDTIEWLESFLMTFKGIVLIISHDRYFLDQTVTRIVEIKAGKAELYGGGYTFYASEKELRYEQQLNHFEQNQKKLKQLEAAAKRLHLWATQADNPKLHKQAFAIEKRIERMPKIEKPLKESAIKNQFTASSLRSKEMLTLEGVCKSFGNQKILDGLTAKVFYKDQIAILGDNGSGKSTLLKLIMDQLNLDSGVAEFAPSVNAAYLPQEIHFDNPNMTVLEFIMDALSLTEGQGRAVLASYKFQQEMVFKKIGTLSGGEKTRLKLCEMMQLKVNFLLLDEPTNHLDLKSREWIEDSIEEYTGTLVFVSHDRHFINKFAKKIWWLKDRKITFVDGDYEKYRAEKQMLQLADEAIGSGGKEALSIVEEKRASHFLQDTNSTKKKNTFMIEKLEREMQDIENQIETIEETIKSRFDDYQSIQALMARKTELEEKYVAVFQKWENYIS
ncbi:ribosomal protection-like ABC-F family protein [Fusibacter ferrireducens]|uniref:ABC-F family ATP-binding cassette domain-containing protein n=1 Tax=Fusibacter ferrireducens TaxID=2785058 RepID=A0ABR9ZQL1_9FIRM|nr:ABC-F family ATP-binding cassette domain-containing protein [Fusibacter ferrireducens]MBF4692750.1 ABC-F family ATP-binding cassette domain-containing protein [Fusibacter ferrireducens]